MIPVSVFLSISGFVPDDPFFFFSALCCKHVCNAEDHGTAVPDSGFKWKMIP